MFAPHKLPWVAGQIGRLADGLKKLNLKYCKARWMKMTAPEKDGFMTVGLANEK